MHDVAESSKPASGRVFLTGGSGFLGRHLIRELVAAGYGVVAMARSPKAEAAVTAAGASAVAAGLEDEDAMRAAMSGCTFVIHAAALASDWGPKSEFLEANVRGTERALRAASAAGVKRFVHIGTEAVLAGGRAIANADETWPYPEHPIGNYAWSKGLAERAVIAANGPALETVVVRPRFIWGTGDTNLLPQLMDGMKSPGWSWFDGGTHRMSTCNVANVCEGTLLALERGVPGEIYFLTDGEPVVFRTFMTDLAATQGVTASNRTAPLIVARTLAAASEAAWSTLPLPGRPLLTKMAIALFFSEVTLNDAKARRDLGYTSHRSIPDGLNQLREERTATVSA